MATDFLENFKTKNLYFQSQFSQYHTTLNGTHTINCEEYFKIFKYLRKTKIQALLKLLNSINNFGKKCWHLLFKNNFICFKSSK